MRLSEENLTLLNKQQGSIIKANDNLIKVSAGPGSGKTHTIANKIAEHLKILDEYRGIIGCSFTRLASKELRERVEKLTDTKYSFIGTIDSFILKEIIEPFSIKYLEYEKDKTLDIIKFKVLFADDTKKVNNLTRMYNSSSDYQKIQSYVQEWYENFQKGIYELSFPSYILAQKIVQKFDLCQKYLKSRYDALYIDEAQDMNTFQHEFVEKMHKHIGLSVIMIGDSNQSIYAFRGSKPKLFNELSSKGYKEYRIDVSVRCHPSIMYLAHKIVDPKANVELEIQENLITLDFNVNDISLVRKLCENETLFLTSSNKYAERVSNYYKNMDIDVVYSRSIMIENKDFNMNYFDLVEELLEFYYNYRSDEITLTYSISEMLAFIDNLDLDSNLVQTEIEDTTIKISEYLSNIFNKIETENLDVIFESIQTQLETESIRSHYKRSIGISRAMTIHSAKGLEADNVILIIENDWNYNAEFKRKLFVAFTRSKSQLGIVFGLDVKNSKLKLDIESIYNEIEKLISE